MTLSSSNPMLPMGNLVVKYSLDVDLILIIWEIVLSLVALCFVLYSAVLL